MKIFWLRHSTKAMFYCGISICVVQCLSNPMIPLYSGGVIKNSEFNVGLTDWTVPLGVQATVNSSSSGNKFAEARTDGQPSRTVYQTVQIQPNTHYSLSGTKRYMSTYFFFDYSVNTHAHKSLHSLSRICVPNIRYKRQKLKIYH